MPPAPDLPAPSAASTAIVLWPRLPWLTSRAFPRVHLGGALPGAILVNLRGERYVDESESDEVSVHALPHQPEALGFMIYSEADAASRDRLGGA